LQAVRVAAETAGEQQRADRLNAAFIGWQFAGTMGGGKKLGPFNKYARKMGLLPPAPRMTPEQQAASRARTEALSKRLISSFKTAA